MLSHNKYKCKYLSVKNTLKLTPALHNPLKCWWVDVLVGSLVGCVRSVFFNFMLLLSSLAHVFPYFRVSIIINRNFKSRKRQMLAASACFSINDCSIYSRGCASKVLLLPIYVSSLCHRCRLVFVVSLKKIFRYIARVNIGKVIETGVSMINMLIAFETRSEQIRCDMNI